MRNKLTGQINANETGPRSRDGVAQTNCWSCDPGKKKYILDGQTICLSTQDVWHDYQCPQSGNPIHQLTGVKSQAQTLPIALAGDTFSIHYRSTAALSRHAEGNSYLHNGKYDPQTGETLAWGDFGKLWSSTFHQRLTINPNGKALKATLGKEVLNFYREGSIWKSKEATGIKLDLIENGYRLQHTAQLLINDYDFEGNLRFSTRSDGTKIKAVYSTSATPITDAPYAGYLLSLTAPFGRRVSFSHKILSDGSVGVTTAFDSAGLNIDFNYDAHARLSTLIWQDGSKRSFVYDSPHSNQEWALTGLIDENSKRHATFTYSLDGWASSTEHANGTNKYTASYLTPPKPVVREEIDLALSVIWRHHEWQLPVGTNVSQPFGNNLQFNATAVLGSAGQNVQGSPRSIGVSQPAGAGCGASSKSAGYDNLGNMTSQDDFNGRRVCYGYDERNQVTSRIEGLNGGNAGTACSAALNAPSFATLPTEARKISTQWHPDWKLETRRAEPKKLTTWVYNGQPDPFNGNQIANCTSPSYGATVVDPLPDGKPIAVLCKQVEQATLDANGSQGFAATLAP
ncbi:MAG: hypothetical protein EOP49_27870, partial [Sphingobacteriales bacterium]